MNHALDEGLDPPRKQALLMEHIWACSGHVRGRFTQRYSQGTSRGDATAGYR